MIFVDIPGFGETRLEHLILDYNGTIATDGKLIPEVKELLKQLKSKLQIHVITSDTHGNAEKECNELPINIKCITEGDHSEQKKLLVKTLGPEICAAIGNGANDFLLLKEARVGIAVIGEEGLSTRSLQCADVVVTGIEQALKLLLTPTRLKATLRT